MSIGALGGLPPLEKPVENPTRSELVRRVHELYHERLIKWCIYKLRSKNLGFNPEDDAEEIVQNVYKQLLESKKPIDLEHPKIEAYLNIALRNAIGRFIKRRKPKGVFVSLEEAEEKSLPFPEHTGEEKEEMYDKIEQALKKLEDRNPKMAHIIKERYGTGKTQVQIAKAYGDRKQNIQYLEKEALRVLRDIVTGKITDDTSIPKGRIKK